VLAVGDTALASLAVVGPEIFALRGAHFSEATLRMSLSLWNVGFGFGTGLLSKELHDLADEGAC